MDAIRHVEGLDKVPHGLPVLVQIPSLQPIPPYRAASPRGQVPHLML